MATGGGGSLRSEQTWTADSSARTAKIHEVSDDKTIRSPLPGTFYRAAGPDEDPYKNEGDEVRAGDVVGLVEVMKMFTELKAEHDGVVDRFLVENGDPIDAGQPIVVLRN